MCHERSIRNSVARVPPRPSVPLVRANTCSRNRETSPRRCYFLGGALSSAQFERVDRRSRNRSVTLSVSPVSFTVASSRALRKAYSVPPAATASTRRSGAAHNRAAGGLLIGDDSHSLRSVRSSIRSFARSLAHRSVRTSTRDDTQTRSDEAGGAHREYRDRGETKLAGSARTTPRRRARVSSARVYPISLLCSRSRSLPPASLPLHAGYTQDIHSGRCVLLPLAS